MSNRLKMVQKELLFTLFNQSWSDRKINSAIGIHRATIARYRQEWQQDQEENLPPVINPAERDSAQNPTQQSVENVPPGPLVSGCF